MCAHKSSIKVEKRKTPGFLGIAVLSPGGGRCPAGCTPRAESALTEGHGGQEDVNRRRSFQAPVAPVRGGTYMGTGGAGATDRETRIIKGLHAWCLPFSVFLSPAEYCS